MHICKIINAFPSASTVYSLLQLNHADISLIVAISSAVSYHWSLSDCRTTTKLVGDATLQIMWNYV